MKNTLADLNNYLFEAIERINDDSLTDEQLEKELKKGKAIQNIAQTIIENAQVTLQAKKHLDQYGNGECVELPMLGVVNK